MLSTVQHLSSPFLLFRFVLKGFATDGRDLTDKETKAFLQAADKDGDGKIGAEGKTKHSKDNIYLLNWFKITVLCLFQNLPLWFANK